MADQILGFTFIILKCHHLGKPAQGPRLHPGSAAPRRSPGSCSPVCVSCSVGSDSLWPHGLSMEFSRQEYWSGWPFPSPGDLPDTGIEPASPALQADSLPSELQGKPSCSAWLPASLSPNPGDGYRAAAEEASLAIPEHQWARLRQRYLLPPAGGAEGPLSLSISLAFFE